MTVRRVFGEPVERDGVILVPAAVIRGGMGGGGGRRHDESTAIDEADSGVASGEGGGFGVVAAPAGAYVLREGQVHWRPAINVNLLVSAATAVMITWLLTQPRARGVAHPRRRS